MPAENKIDLLVANCLRLKGDSPKNVGLYSYGASLCLKCKGAIQAEGQEALQAMATERGIFFRIKVPCALPFRSARCDGTVGYVELTKDEVA